MQDLSDRIIKINEAISFLFERDGRSFEELRTQRMGQRIEQEKKRAELRQLQQAKKEEKNQQFIKRWNSDDEIKRLGLDTNKLPKDDLARARAIRKASWQSVQDTLARQPKFEDIPLGRQAAEERKRIAQREIGDAVPEGTSPEDMVTRYYGGPLDPGEIKTQMASARQHDAMTPGQKQAKKDREAEQRIANWEAGQKQKMLGRIGAGGEAGAQYVAAEGEARAAEQNLRNVISNQQTYDEIRAETRAGKQAREDEIRRSLTASELESGQREAEEKIGAERVPDANFPGGYRLRKKPESSTQPNASTSGPNASTSGQQGKSKFEFYNRQTGKIETSDAPGVDRVFRDSSGKAYRIEGGSGRKVYV